MTIGTVNGKPVKWNENSKTITVYGTYIMMTGADSKEKAVRICKRNLKNFTETVERK